MVAEDFLQDPQVRQWLDGVADLDAAQLRLRVEFRAS